MGILLFLVFAVLFPPYAICYVSVLYIASGGDVAAPPRRPAGCPASRRPLRRRRLRHSGLADPRRAPSRRDGVTAPAAPPAAGADAWKAAADPLAGQPPAPAAGRRRPALRPWPRRTRPPVPARRTRPRLADEPPSAAAAEPQTAVTQVRRRGSRAARSASPSGASRAVSSGRAPEPPAWSSVTRAGAAAPGAPGFARGEGRAGAGESSTLH